MVRHGRGRHAHLGVLADDEPAMTSTETAMPNQPSGGNSLERVPRRLVDLGASITSPVGRTVYRLLEQPIERFLSLDALNRLYSGMSPVASDAQKPPWNRLWPFSKLVSIPTTIP